MTRRPPVWGIPPDDVIHPEFFIQAPLVWHLPRDIWEPIWQDGADGSHTTGAILDTGINPHTDLPPIFYEASEVSGESPRDGHGHGSHCAGTMLGRNAIGVAPSARLMNIKVLSNRGSGSSAGIARGIRRAVDNGADVISMSLGGGSSYAPTNSAIDYAWSKGRLVVAAAGNSGFNGRTNTIGWPAKYKSCICTGATRSDGSIAGFSSGGVQMDWACPGQAIVSCSRNGSGYVTMSGTSMATPFSAGVLLLIVELMRREGEAEWTAKESFDAFIKEFADDRGAPGHDPSFGHGVPQVTDIVHSLARKEIKWV